MRQTLPLRPWARALTGSWEWIRAPYDVGFGRFYTDDPEATAWLLAAVAAAGGTTDEWCCPVFPPTLGLVTPVEVAGRALLILRDVADGPPDFGSGPRPRRRWNLHPYFGISYRVPDPKPTARARHLPRADRVGPPVSPAPARRPAVSDAPKPSRPRKSRAVLPGGTPADPAQAPHAPAKTGVVKYPYAKLRDPAPPPFPVYGDPAKFAAPFTPDEFQALAAAYDRQFVAQGDFIMTSHTPPVIWLEVVGDLRRKYAGSIAGEALGWMAEAGFMPTFEQWQIPDPEDPNAGEETASLVTVCPAPAEHLHHLWAPDNDPDTVWPHTWRSMIPDGMAEFRGGKLNRGDERPGLAAAHLTASLVRELTATPDHVVTLTKLWADHRARQLL